MAYEMLHSMRRATTTLALRRRVDFALLLGAVKMRQRGQLASRAAADGVHKNNGSVDGDNGNVYGDDKRLC
jgi:hypothetical protein